MGLHASAGNRTRVTSMATMYSTTRPLMLLVLVSGRTARTLAPHCEHSPVPVAQLVFSTPRLSIKNRMVKACGLAPSPGFHVEGPPLLRLPCFSSALGPGPAKPQQYHTSRARGVVVSHPLSMREALGSIPSVSIRATRLDHSATAASRPPLCLNHPACCWPPHCEAQSRIASCCEKRTPGHMAKRASLEQFSSLAQR